VMLSLTELANTMVSSPKMISSNAMLGDDTMVLANSVSDNITLELPYAGNVSGRIYRIKRLSLYNQVWISGGGNVIDDTSPIELLNVNGLATIELMSNGTQWYKLAEESSSSTVATENLMGWWKMDESSGSLLLDSTDHGHDLTPAGSQTVSGGSTEGVMGRGQHFDNDTGAYSYTLANHNDFQLNRFSIMCWLKPERTFANMTSLYPAIFSKQNWVGNAGYYFGVFLGDTNNLGLRLMNGAGVGNRVEVTYLDSTFGIWFHVAATTDGTVLRIYKNGQLQSSVSAPATLNHDTQAMSIGAGYEGSLDDLRFYNKALSAAEIKVIYDGAR